MISRLLTHLQILACFIVLFISSYYLEIIKIVICASELKLYVSHICGFWQAQSIM